MDMQRPPDLGKHPDSQFASDVINICRPWWFHVGGEKMEIKEFSKEHHTLSIQGKGAEIFIQTAGAVHPGTAGWLVDWRVIHKFQPFDEEVSGRRHFSSEELATALGLSEGSGKTGQAMLNQHAIDSVELGKYARWKTALNIPGIGTGNDGDPNVSVRITAEMQEAVKELLS